MKTGHRFAIVAVLGAVSAPAHAHGVPVWMFVAAATPLLVLILAAIYGWLARSVRAAAIHAFLVVVWVVWFWLASNHNEVTLFGLSTDHVIWTAMVLYVLHALLLAILVPIHVIRRLKTRTSTPMEGTSH